MLLSNWIKETTVSQQSNKADLNQVILCQHLELAVINPDLNLPAICKSRTTFITTCNHSQWRTRKRTLEVARSMTWAGRAEEAKPDRTLWSKSWTNIKMNSPSIKIIQRYWAIDMGQPQVRNHKTNQAVAISQMAPRWLHNLLDSTHRLLKPATSQSILIINTVKAKVQAACATKGTQEKPEKVRRTNHTNHPADTTWAQTTKAPPLRLSLLKDQNHPMLLGLLVLLKTIWIHLPSSKSHQKLKLQLRQIPRLKRIKC